MEFSVCFLRNPKAVMFGEHVSQEFHPQCKQQTKPDFQADLVSLILEWNSFIHDIVQYQANDFNDFILLWFVKIALTFCFVAVWLQYSTYTLISKAPPFLLQRLSHKDF